MSHLLAGQVGMRMGMGVPGPKELKLSWMDC